MASGWRRASIASRRPASPDDADPPARLGRAATSASSGYTNEELRLILEPMARTGAEPIGSMGSDTPIAVLSRPAAAALRLLHPALRPGDQPAPRRHPRGARHLARGHGRPGAQPARARPAESCRQIVPALARSSTTTTWPSSSMSTSTARRPGSGASPSTGCSRSAAGGPGLEAALDKVCEQVSRGHRRRGRTSSCFPTATPTPHCAPIPSLLADRRGAPPPGAGEERTRVGLVVESGRRPRGAPLRPAHRLSGPPRSTRTSPSSRSPRWCATACWARLSEREASAQLHESREQGCLKVMSKMGISTVASYTGAQVFEAIGLDRERGGPVLRRHAEPARRRRP